MRRALPGRRRRSADFSGLANTMMFGCSLARRRGPRRLPAGLLSFQPDPSAVLTDAAVAQALRAARRGTAAGLSGTTYEHHKILPNDARAVELFAHAANLLAAAPRVSLPTLLASLRSASRLGGVRGIATGDTFQRLVSRSLAWRPGHTTSLCRPKSVVRQRATASSCQPAYSAVVAGGKARTR